VSTRAGVIRIRKYRPRDAVAVGRLIARTYREFNMVGLSAAEQDKLLGPFRHAESGDPAHQKTIAEVLRSPMLYVATMDGEIVGVLRGRENVLASLFVHESACRKGIGRRLVERFERDSGKLSVTWIRVAATEYAVPFYLAVGYRKTTGLRNFKSFDGTGLKYQPMKKLLQDG
jgi:GNAT superfamily N-acetyltransferase